MLPKLAHCFINNYNPWNLLSTLQLVDKNTIIKFKSPNSFSTLWTSYCKARYHMSLQHGSIGELVPQQQCLQAGQLGWKATWLNVRTPGYSPVICLQITG